MPSTHPIVRPDLDPPLGTGETHQRPIGRIGPANDLAPGALCADFDACYLDNQPITSRDDWNTVLARGRLADVEGAFALAWADEDGTLHLARDGVGERTLFYAPRADGIAFASALPELLRAGLVPRRLHLPAVGAYLCYAYLPGRE